MFGFAVRKIDFDRIDCIKLILESEATIYSFK
jgi:hypothetical protein